MIVSAFAKINLSLDIVGKRNDGYHLLKTVMQTVDLCDEISIEKSSEISLTASEKDVPTDSTNTAYKAAQNFFEFAKINSGAKIHIEKHIPSQAGMGGASADAGAVIYALDKLYDTNLSKEDLLKIGLSVGADVPFCMLGKTALCEGIGEIITPLKSIPDCYIVLCKPESGVSTKSAYLSYDNGECGATSYTDNLLNNFDSLSGIASNLKNVFEDLCSNPEIDIIKMQMKSAGALGCCMTGSGSVVFGIFDDKQKAEYCKEQLEEDYPFSCVCKPKN